LYITCNSSLVQILWPVWSFTGPNIFLNISCFHVSRDNFICSVFTHVSQQNSSITSIGSLSPLLGVEIVHFVDRTDLFKISKLVYNGREIVRSLYSNLQGQTVYGGYSELAGSLFVIVKSYGLGNFWNN
jgi:hypothetical protein